MIRLELAATQEQAIDLEMETIDGEDGLFTKDFRNIPAALSFSKANPTVKTEVVWVVTIKNAVSEYPMDAYNEAVGLTV